jgi:hypothetical protein
LENDVIIEIGIGEEKSGTEWADLGKGVGLGF